MVCTALGGATLWVTHYSCRYFQLSLKETLNLWASELFHNELCCINDLRSSEGTKKIFRGSKIICCKWKDCNMPCFKNRYSVQRELLSPNIYCVDFNISLCTVIFFPIFSLMIVFKTAVLLYFLSFSSAIKKKIICCLCLLATSCIMLF